MYGTRETLCLMLAEQYPAQTPLNIVVWSPSDIEAIADGMEYRVSDDEIQAVLELIDGISEEQQLEYGVSVGAVGDLITQVKESNPIVTVPVQLLESILFTAEQALWRKEWEARDTDLPIPKSVIRRLSDVSEMRVLIKK